MSLDLNRLRVFLEAARARSYTLAGERLHTSQSAVSHGVRKLEESVDRKLVEWKGKRFSLTEDGAYLLEVCERVFQDIDVAERTIAARGESVPRRIVLGATVEFGTTVLIGRMRPLLDEHPLLHMDYVFSHNLLEPLLRGEVDLIVDCVDHRHSGLTRTNLFREKYAVVAAPEIFRGKPPREPRDLEAFPLLSMDPDGSWWDRVRRSLPPGSRPVIRRIIAMNHLRGIVNAAVSGVGVGLVPRYTVLEELAEGSLVELFEDMGLLEDVFRIYQKRSRANDAMNRIVTGFLLNMDPGNFGDSIGSISRA